MYTACFTGHRKIRDAYYNRNNPSPEWNTLKTYMRTLVHSLMLEPHNISTFISGLAIGVDMLGAECVALSRTFVKGQINLIGAMPFPSQASRWPAITRKHWDDVCAICNSVVAVSEDPYHPSKMQIRNQWMVDRSHYVIAVWDGQPGGTWNCMSYALKQNKPVLRVSLDPDVLSWENEWITEVPHA